MMRRLGIYGLIGLALVWMGCPKSPKLPQQEGKALPLQFYAYQNLRMVHSPGDEAMVHFAVQFLGGVENYPTQLQGIEKVALEMVVRSAPKGTDRTAFLSQLDELGASVGVEWHADYSLLTLDCPVEKWRPSLKMMLKWVRDPQFLPETFAQVKDWARLEAERHAKDPEEALQQQVMEAVYAGKPYQKYWGGTTQTLRSLTLEEVQKYYSQFLLQTCRMAFLWSGRPERFDVEEQLAAEWGQLGTGNCQNLPQVQVFPQQSTLHFSEGPSSQYRMWALFPGADAYSADAAALQLAMRLLEHKLEKSMADEEAFALRQSAGVWPMKQGLCGIYFLTAQPNRCATATVQAMREAIVAGFSAEELGEVRELAYAAFWLGSESGKERMNLAARVNVLPEPVSALAYPRIIKNLQADEVNRVFRKYATALTWVVSGPSQGVDEPFFVSPVRE